jgi:8-oxo-dGTP pyrophosphatase MutT (NUDIX family)
MHYAASAFVWNATNCAALVLCRAQSSRSWRKQWELPGGQLEPNERPDQAAERELHEETGINGTANALLGEYLLNGYRGKVKYMCYSMQCRELSVRLSPAHESYMWMRHNDLETLRHQMERELHVMPSTQP